MPAYNFQARFAPLVMSGQKQSTIRGREAKVGTVAYLFTGMRTKKCVRLGAGRIVRCRPITLGYHQNGVARAKLGYGNVSQTILAEIAALDGFENARELVDWFATTYKESRVTDDGGRDVFAGYQITWELCQ